MSEIQKIISDMQSLNADLKKRLDALEKKVKKVETVVAENSWNDIVFGCFASNKIYSNERIYEKVHKKIGNSKPNNNTVEASVRRTLQNLRDLNKLEHVGRGYWKKN